MSESEKKVIVTKKEVIAAKEAVVAEEPVTVKKTEVKKTETTFTSTSPVGSKEYTDELAAWELEHAIKSE